MRRTLSLWIAVGLGLAQGVEAGAAPAPMPPAMQPPAQPPPAATPPSSTAPAPAPAKEPELKPDWKPHAGASIDLGGRKKIYVGDVFKVRVTIIARTGISVNLPTSLELGDFSQHGGASVKTEKLDGQKTKHVFTLRIAAFGVGDLVLPPIPVTYVPPRAAFQDADSLGGANVPALTVQTKLLRQHISSVLANEPHPQLKKNAPPVQILVEDRQSKMVLLVIAGVLVGVALGIVLFLLIRKRRRRAKPLPPPRPAHEIALEKLNAVRAANYLDRGEFKPFYFGVSEAIREYLGNRYGFDSLELTTTELMDNMRPVEMAGIGHSELEIFLSDCDLVKFARYIPPLEDAQRIVAQAEHIVHTTKWIPQPTEEQDDEDDEGSTTPKKADAPDNRETAHG